MRRVLKVPYKAHTGLLPLIANQLPIEFIIYRRILNFHCSLQESNNNCLKFLSRRCIGSSTSNLGRNLNFFISKYGLDLYQDKRRVIQQFTDAFTSEWFSQSEHLIQTASVCMEMLLVRDNYLTCNLDLAECILILEEQSTN